MRSASSRVFSGRGFTLVEVALGLAILVLIFAAMFRLVQFSVIGADEAGKISVRSREVSGFFALMRQLCLDLSPKSLLRLESAGLGWGDDLFLTEAPLSILPQPGGGVRTLRFGLEKVPGGTGKALVMEEIFERTNPPNRFFPPVTNRFELMRDVVRLDWLPGNPNNRDKMEEPGWSDSVKPAYLKAVLVSRQRGKNSTNTGIFWIPSGYGPSGQIPVDFVTRTALGAPAAGSSPGTNSGSGTPTSPGAGATSGTGPGSGPVVEVTVPK